MKIAAFLRPSAMRHRSNDESGGMAIAMQPGAPAAWATSEHVRMMEQSVEEPGDGGRIAEEFAPVLDGTIRGDQGGRLLVPAHHELEQILGRGLREFAHPEVVDDEQRDGRHRDDVLFARAGELRFSEIVEERMRLAIEDAMALLDRGEAEGLRQVALAGARWA